MSDLPERPVQRLPRAAYLTEDWFEKEQDRIFGRAWTLAGVATDFAAPGDYRTLSAGPYGLAVLRDGNGTLRAFHNLCRHRGTELLEGSGNAGERLVCPYHRWVYGLDGGLRGVPNQATCFPDLERADHGLLPAGLGTFRGLVFVHPDPDADFDRWVAALHDLAWPHDLGDTALRASPPVTYDMACNWKVFFENAVDGYHLAHLHQRSLGGPKPGENRWEAHGDHLVWYATDRGGTKRAISGAVAEVYDAAGARTIAGAADANYGGVYMLFPGTIVLPTPYDISLSRLIPMTHSRTLLETRTFSPNGQSSQQPEDLPGYDPSSGRISLARLTVPPPESGDFQIEDMWICEKIQRALRSPAFRAGPLARGAGAEAPIGFFQDRVLGQLNEQDRPAGPWG